MFGRKAYITLEKGNVEIDGCDYDYIESFGISISNFRETWQLNGLDPSKTVYLINALSEARKKEKRRLRLELNHSTFTEYIDIPRWAYSEIIEQILRYIGYKHGE